MLKWILCGSEGSYDDFHLCDNQINAAFYCKILISAVQQRSIIY